MIFKIKYNFVILELIGQPYFDLKRNNSKNVQNKCLINCFRINSLSSNLRDKTIHNRDTNLVAYHASWRAISPSNLISNGYFSNHTKRRHPRLKVRVSFYLYFCCFWINFTQINFENIKRTIQSIIFYLKRNNSKNVQNKCLINCFRINSLSSNLRDKTIHLSIQHCFYVVFYIIGTQ